MKPIILVLAGICILAGLVLAVNNTIKLQGSEWVCIAEECVDFATGDEWVDNNCFYEGVK